MITDRSVQYAPSLWTPETEQAEYVVAEAALTIVRDSRRDQKRAYRVYPAVRRMTNDEITALTA